MRLERIKKVTQGLLFYDLRSGHTLAAQLERRSQRQPERLFVIYKDRKYTYQQANQLINRHAHAYKSLGVEKGDVVALDLENRPEFYWHFFGLNKIGAVASLINTNAAGDVLAHALRVCAPARIVVGSEVWPAFADVRDKLDGIAADAFDVDMDPEHPAEGIDRPPWQQRVDAASDENPPETGRHTLADTAAYIYTSGTTGMPKPAVIKHHRFYRAGRIWGGLAFRFEKTDILYNCLPLYHSNGIMLASGCAISYGIPIALGRKFSATRFWDEIRAHDASAFMYIGELCRYLLNQPPSPRDREHRVRAMSGNGLRPELWEPFQRRFGIERISEWYASTEGNAITINPGGTGGSVGPLLPKMALVRWDDDRQDFVRNAKGRLIKCKMNQPGILLAKITPRQSFDGYTDAGATETKIVRNAFKQGDAWFNTGDMLRYNWQRRLFFVDRLGDTFRYKGENVSTFEVEQQLCKWAPVAEANVYGVTVAGTEGRAGMASLVLVNGEEFDPAAFRAHVDEALPSYARPLFLRICSQLESTSTLKIKKVDLQKQGFDPSIISDPLYIRHPDRNAYVPLDQSLHRQLQQGGIKL